MSGDSPQAGEAHAPARPPSVTSWQHHPLYLPIIVAGLALVILVPLIWQYGLWDPQEIAIADQAREVVKNGKWLDVYAHRPPLTTWLISASIAIFGPSEFAARLPLALVGVLGALATYGLGARLRRPRAGLFAAIVLVSSPLFVFESRQLTSDVGAVAAAALAMFGLAGLAWPRGGQLDPAWAAIDAALAVAGLLLGHLSAGFLNGCVVPLAAVTLAIALALAGKFSTGGASAVDAAKGRTTHVFMALGGGLIVLASLVWIFASVFDLVDAQPGQLGVGGKTISASKEYLALVGGTWKTGDPAPTATFNWLLEQVVFGLFPWSAIAPVAVGRLAFARSRDRSAWAGLLVLSWLLIAYAAGALTVREVGEIRFPALAGLALAVGFLLDDLLAAKVEGQVAAAPSASGSTPLAALLVIAAGAQVARDCVLFPDELASVHLLKNIKHPVELKAYLYGIAALGAIVAAAVAVALVVGTEPGARIRRRVAQVGLWTSAGAGVAFGLYLSLIYTPALSEHFSYKNLFQSYFDHRTGSEPLGVMGIAGSGPEYYARGPFERVNALPQLLEFLKRDQRVFAITPADKLCPIHQQSAGGQLSYYVLDDRNSRFLLLTNRLVGEEVDHNPLLTAFRTEAPLQMKRAISANFDNKIELLGVDMPDAVDHGDKFKVTLWFKVLQKIPTNYKIFVHFDGRGVRFQGDHDPIGGRCGTSFWQPGAIVADTFEVTAGELTHPNGPYSGHVGFFTGSSGNWKNMTVVSDNKDSNNRVPIGTIRLK